MRRCLRSWAIRWWGAYTIPSFYRWQIEPLNFGVFEEKNKGGRKEREEKTKGKKDIGQMCVCPIDT